MKKKIRYTNEAMGDVLVVKDFLPPPEKLIFKKEENIKVTINLNKSSVEFFKHLAKKNNVQYQKVIRNLLDYYASYYEK
ncbi:MAG: CopG family transcriptional regulator [Acidobacteriota bacterium]